MTSDTKTLDILLSAAKTCYKIHNYYHILQMRPKQLNDLIYIPNIVQLNKTQIKPSTHHQSSVPVALSLLKIQTGQNDLSR